MKIALIGCGEVGFTYALALLQAQHGVSIFKRNITTGVNQLMAYPNCTFYNSIGNWLSNVDLVISCVTGVAALEVAQSIFPYLTKNTLYADFTTADPVYKQKAAVEAKCFNIYYVDVVIIGGINLTGMATPLLCAGEQAESLATIMREFGVKMNIRVLPNSKVGDAATLKLLRTIFLKGLEALAVECVTAAEQNGVKELLYEILSDVDATPLGKFLDMLLRTHVVHAPRRLHEVLAATQQLTGAGFKVEVLQGVKALFETTCENLQKTPVNSHPTTTEAITWLLSTRLNTGQV